MSIKKLEKLFEYQRFAGNEKLSGQIERVRMEYFGGVEIDDEELELAAAGISGSFVDTAKRIEKDYGAD